MENKVSDIPALILLLEEAMQKCGSDDRVYHLLGASRAALRAQQAIIDDMARDGFLGDPPKYVTYAEFQYWRDEAQRLLAGEETT
jgi:hypothetical protein